LIAGSPKAWGGLLMENSDFIVYQSAPLALAKNITSSIVMMNQNEASRYQQLQMIPSPQGFPQYQ
jgi:hypothetical protein